jgi:hypothetical protein
MAQHVRIGDIIVRLTKEPSNLVGWTKRTEDGLTFWYKTATQCDIIYDPYTVVIQPDHTP